ncbi:oligosaccharide flippase family protein [Paenibacillus piri]|nr:oligosaccharide flippase family protein [Paenibacillus piri]
MRLPDLAKQTALRTGAIFVVKVIGFFARVVLFRLLGSEGIGLYQMAYSVYALFLTVITGGFPTALALATAKDPGQGWRLFKGTAVFLALFGLVLGFYCYSLAPRIAVLLGDAKLEFAVRCAAPAVAIVPFLSLLRGLLQGMEYYGYIAASEFIEQVFRVAPMVVIATVWLQYGVPYAVGGSMLGAPIGAFMSLCFLLAVIATSTVHKLKIIDKAAFQKLKKPGVILFIYSALSIFATRLIVPASDFLDALIIPRRLQAAGLSVSEATSVYGIITGMALTIVYMPAIVTSALAFTLSTKITADWELGRQERFAGRTSSAMQIVWLWGCGSALVLFFYAGDLSFLIFSSGAAETAIRYMALAPLLSGIRELSTVALWGTGNKKTPLTGLIVGVICSLTLNYCLLAVPGFAYAGAAIGILSLELIAALWNLNGLRRYTKGVMDGLLPGTVVVTLLFTVCLFLAKLSAQFLSLPRSVQSVGEMTLIYGSITLCLFVYFLKKERRLL